MNTYNIIAKTIELIESNLDNKELNICFLSQKILSLGIKTAHAQ
jgi:hypothetical protein